MSSLILRSRLFCVRINAGTVVLSVLGPENGLTPDANGKRTAWLTLLLHNVTQYVGQNIT